MDLPRHIAISDPVDADNQLFVIGSSKLEIDKLFLTVQTPYLYSFDCLPYSVDYLGKVHRQHSSIKELMDELVSTGLPRLDALRCALTPFHGVQDERINQLGPKYRRFFREPDPSYATETARSHSLTCFKLAMIYLVQCLERTGTPKKRIRLYANPEESLMTVTNAIRGPAHVVAYTNAYNERDMREWHSIQDQYKDQIWSSKRGEEIQKLSERVIAREMDNLGTGWLDLHGGELYLPLEDLAESYGKKPVAILCGGPKTELCKLLKTMNIDRVVTQDCCISETAANNLVMNPFNSAADIPSAIQFFTTKPDLTLECLPTEFTSRPIPKDWLHLFHPAVSEIIQLYWGDVFRARNDFPLHDVYILYVATDRNYQKKFPTGRYNLIRDEADKGYIRFRPVDETEWDGKVSMCEPRTYTRKDDLELRNYLKNLFRNPHYDQFWRVLAFLQHQLRLTLEISFPSDDILSNLNPANYWKSASGREDLDWALIFADLAKKYKRTSSICKYPRERRPAFHAQGIEDNLGD